MGCPAKKVCNKWAGSALMQDETLALQIVEAVVAACEPHGVPVTLKMRTGWCQSAKNAPVLALAAERAGVQMLTVHGRTREQGYKGQAEHDTVAAIKARVSVPVVANGDITTPEAARDVLARTGCDAIMIGRAAQGRPWLFREIAHFLATGTHLAPPTPRELQALMLEHLTEHHGLYGAFTGVRTARKHLGWYTKALPGDPAAIAAFRERINRIDTCDEQLRCVQGFFTEQHNNDWKQAA
jgi:tRNA-dihydrouridine synthase B